MNEATVVSRDYLSSCTSSTPYFLFGPVSLCSSFCFAVSTAWRAVTPAFDFTFLFQAPPLFAESFAGHFENTIVPYRRPPKLHFVNFEHSCGVFSNFSQRDYRYSTNTNYLRYDVASFPGPAQLFVACSTEKLYRTNSDGKLGGAWERG